MAIDRYKLTDLLGDEDIADHLIANGVITVSCDPLGDKVEMCRENGYEDTMLFDNFDYGSAFIGLTHDGRAVYDFDLMVEWLKNNEGWSEIEAVEWIETNTERALPYAGEKAPVILYRFM